MQIKIIGAGLAGCEAALWLADHGVQVDLYEQKPVKFSPAHKSAGFAELICSNSLKAERPDSASGLLKIEMRMMGSHLLDAAETARVAAGGALAVDRDVFSTAVTEMVEKNPNITVHREEVTALDESVPVLVASGPLTEGALAEQIAALTGSHRLSFFDAVAPIVSAESLDMEKIFAASRYGRGEADYLNCPFNKLEYETFYNELLNAERAPLHDFDGELTVYEGCMPIEVMAGRGADTMRYGPLRPVGLRDPRTGHRPWANVQLRAEKHRPHAVQYRWFPDQFEMGRAEARFFDDSRPGTCRVHPLWRDAPQYLFGKPGGADQGALPERAPQRVFCRADHRV